MNKDLVTITNENNEKHDYKLLMVIDKDFKYLQLLSTPSTETERSRSPTFQDFIQSCVCVL